MSDSAVVGILLAAGNSSRFGSDKLLYPMAKAKQTLPIAQLTAQRFRPTCDIAIAIIKPKTDQTLQSLLRNEGFSIVISPESINGMGSSIANGVLVTPNAKGWIIALADMPFIKTDTYRKVATTLRDGASIAVPTFEGQQGHPVGFSKKWQKQLISLTGDSGARSILTSAVEEISFLPVNDSGILRDIDCQADLADCFMED